MKTEIEKLKEYRKKYENAKNEKEYQKATLNLGKIFDKYGTIEIVEIQNLIN